MFAAISKLRLRAVVIGISLMALERALAIEPHLPPGIEPLTSAAPHGRGPLALVNLNHHALGYAYAFGGKMPDLFVAGYRAPQAVYLFRWLATAETGAPVFAQPVEVKCALKDQGTVFQTADGIVHGLWINKGELVLTQFDQDALEFRETGRVPLAESIKSPSTLAAIANQDASFDLVFDQSNGAKGYKGNQWTEEWRPYNSSGIAVGELSYRYLVESNLRGGRMEPARQITATKSEVYGSMPGLTPVDLGAGHERDLMTGSRQGNFLFYHNRSAGGFDLEKKRLIAGEDGNALRHPSINPSVCAFPNAT
ncbi:MAG: hypothetical protein ABI680_17400, partial [Chthoniobacteraceae bacterium]